VPREPGAGLGERGRRGLDDESRAVVTHNLERTAGVRGRDDRFLGEERLVGNQSEVLIYRRVVDGQAARIEIGELLFRDSPRKARAAVEASLPGKLLQPLAIGPLAGDHAT
jgi:hypothetical protein